VRYYLVLNEFLLIYFLRKHIYISLRNINLFIRIFLNIFVLLSCIVLRRNTCYCRKRKKTYVNKIHGVICYYCDFAYVYINICKNVKMCEWRLINKLARMMWYDFIYARRSFQHYAHFIPMSPLMQPLCFFSRVTSIRKKQEVVYNYLFMQYKSYGLVIPFFSFNFFFFFCKVFALRSLLGTFGFFFYKIKFRGKGYHMYRNRRNTIVFRFGRCHRSYRYGVMLTAKTLSKTSILFFSPSLSHIHNTLLQVRAVRSINRFTLRGIRFARQIVYKKIGKVSSYR
jgi:hypothetical protein